MLYRINNVAAFVLRRPWLVLPFALWIILSMAYYWVPLSLIEEVKSTNQMYQQILNISNSVVNMRHTSDDTVTQNSQLSDQSGTTCETIHISLVCMGKCGHHITTMLKSLLYHRQNPLHFHIIVDTKSEKKISILFDTWDLPDVKYTCYNAESALSRVSWIPNIHHAGVYTMMKLLNPDILPKSLPWVLVLDYDLTFLCDIAELWALFKNMTDKQLIGLVQNESRWYMRNHSWPAVGRGYNAGVMLLNLQHIHEHANWTQLWHDALHDNLQRLGFTALGDQDVLNAIIKKYPDILYNISCQYNVQMSKKSLAKYCYGVEMKKVKIIHWNSPKKSRVVLKDAPYFRDVYRSFENLDGGLLRTKLHRCWPARARNETSVREGTRIIIRGTIKYKFTCASFRAASRAKLRTHVYYLEFGGGGDAGAAGGGGGADSSDVSVALQLSMDRLQSLDTLATYWEGPISAAVYLADSEVPRLERFIRKQAALGARTNIDYHLVYKSDDTMHYPVNYLRNVALEHVSTPYVFLMDADFVPMEGLYQHLRHAVRAVDPYPLKKCLVVPAFESQRYRAMPPRNMRELVSRLSTRRGGGRGGGGGRRGNRTADVVPFRAHEWNYSRWVHATAPYEVEWEADYEPYLVVHRSVPKYDTRFSGFGWNKMSHITQLRAMRYRAVVLPDAFVVHTAHAPSAGSIAYQDDWRYRMCIALLKQEFLDDLSQKYNVTFDNNKWRSNKRSPNKRRSNKRSRSSGHRAARAHRRRVTHTPRRVH